MNVYVRLCPEVMRDGLPTNSVCMLDLLAVCMLVSLGRVRNNILMVVLGKNDSYCERASQWLRAQWQLQEHLLWSFA